MKRLTLLVSTAALLLFSLNAFAGRVQIVRSENKNGAPLLQLWGEDFCNAHKYRIRMTNDLTGEDDKWYAQLDGQTLFNVNHNQDGSCRFYRQLQNVLLNPGYVLEIETYGNEYYNYPLERFVVDIPCFVKDKWHSSLGPVTVVKCDNDTLIVPRSTVPTGRAEAPEQKCFVTMSAAEGSNRADVNILCNYGTGLDVRVYNLDNGNLLGANGNFYAKDQSFHPGTALSVLRDPNFLSRYRIEMTTANGQQLEPEIKTIMKDPTFFYEPKGDYTHDRNIALPKKQNWARNGYYWKGNISAEIIDKDVDDPTYYRSFITVELIKLVNGREVSLETKQVMSGYRVSFSVEHVLIQPNKLTEIFGQKEHTEGQLDEGLNTLFIRVWDAYGAPGKSLHTDLKRVSVDVKY
jgi:hypothetical protein